MFERQMIAIVFIHFKESEVIVVLTPHKPINMKEKLPQIRINIIF